MTRWRKATMYGFRSRFGRPAGTHSSSFDKPRGMSAELHYFHYFQQKNYYFSNISLLLCFYSFISIYFQLFHTHFIYFFLISFINILLFIFLNNKTYDKTKSIYRERFFWQRQALFYVFFLNIINYNMTIENTSKRKIYILEYNSKITILK